MRIWGVVALAALPLAGCVTNETVSFRASGSGQQAIIRDGQSALVSRQKNSLVLVRPASREIATGGRPVFVVGINNISPKPVNFLVTQVEASQMVGEQAFAMQVITYEALVQEEKNRQVGRAMLAGLARARMRTALRSQVTARIDPPPTPRAARTRRRAHTSAQPPTPSRRTGRPRRTRR